MPPSLPTLTTPILLLLFLLSAVSSSSLPPEDGIRVVYSEKRIDLTGPIVKVFLTLKIENAPAASDASQVLLAFTPTEVEHLAIVKATRAEGKHKKKAYIPLLVEASDLAATPNGARLYSVLLGTPLKPGEATTLKVLYVLTHSLEPFPAEISQSESQLVYYRDSAVLLSPYHVLEQVNYIKMPSNRIESFTRVDPTSRAGTEVKYGTYNNQMPNSYLPILVHYENNRPFAIIEELVRKVEISHWGNVQITEQYKLKHGGARHKGVFSRLEYQSRPSISGASSFKNLLARLPPRVYSVYYRDEIGNISSSHLRTDSHKSELEIEPRYPLFGGWHCTFTIGYGLPLQDFVFESIDGGRYINLTFGCPLLDTVVDDLTIKVVLPEGSKNPQPVVPFLTEQHLETSYSYLDVVGRTTVVLKKKNVVGEHNVPFQVHYDFNPIFMLAEPLMLISAVFLFFVACIAYLHMDLSIGKSS
ncbi:dolichyl-diphosphooligosaccharide--protein glycosyltransferase subunit 1B [Phragmites australis]|uniref:dolichyl-diphosphooligosaccharide--protein glycosyltransferase subunit 1B n=1 Tax=Phragmites australis TaxID=29695 RepID=UPI002D768F79|nr:dolichyl-diphosphooligosaccharide--protein glycosyltransferase subunit 1B [Phragmites australis]